MAKLTFWEVVTDEEKNEVSISGPSTNDISLTKRTYDLQCRGVSIRCNTPEIKNYPTKESIIEEYARMGYKYVEHSILSYYESKNLKYIQKPI